MNREEKRELTKTLMCSLEDVFDEWYAMRQKRDPDFGDASVEVSGLPSSLIKDWMKEAFFLAATSVADSVRVASIHTQEARPLVALKSLKEMFGELALASSCMAGLRCANHPEKTPSIKNYDKWMSLWVPGDNKHYFCPECRVKYEEENQ